jgi:hypothetical protein
MHKLNKVKAITCEEARTRFNDFIDDFIKGEEKTELLQHLEQCSHCFGRVEFERMLKEKISQSTVEINYEVISKLTKLVQ